MNIDTADLALIGELTDAETDLFRLAAQTLLSRSFILRGTDKGDTLWDFSIRNIRLLDAWFACAGVQLKRDEMLGVIALRPGSSMRARLGKEETCALLVARLLFEEKRAELSLSRFPSIRVFDFVQRYRAVIGSDLKKTRLVDVLRSFGRWHLVDTDGEAADPETTVILYPSLALALDQNAVDEILAAVEKERQGEPAIEDAGQLEDEE
ncbi:MAG: DUF4194 domain-containing protein [Spirochaetales bacterium]|nr:DUF4194 domain-containing protein [Spirochaetales bacterium]